MTMLILLPVTWVVLAPLFCVFSYRKYGTILNPIVFFTAVVFLNNFSYSFINLFYTMGSYVKYSESSQTTGLTLNIFGYISACVSIVCFSNSRPRSQTESERLVPPEVLEVTYLVLAFGVFALMLLSGGGGAYGEGQALTSSAAFTPLAVIFSSRYFLVMLSFAMRIFQGKGVNFVFMIASISIEAILMFLHGSRKWFFVMMLGLFLTWLMGGTRMRLKHYFIGLGFVAVMLFVSIFMGNARALIGGGSIIDRIEYGIKQSGVDDNPIASALNSNNSEPLQYWVNDVWIDGNLDYLWGKTYIQALINLVVPRPLQGSVVDWQAAYVFKSYAYADVDNMGYDFAFSAEAFINFGVWFFVFPYLVLGCCIGKIYSGRKSGFLMFYLSGVVFAIFSAFFRTDSTALFRVLFLAIVPYLLLRMIFGVPSLRRNGAGLRNL